MDLYRDRWIICNDEEVLVHGYYFPWGTKRIRYESIKGIRRVEMGALRGKGRIWGTANLKYWASLDPRRPSKSTALILDLGRRVSPFLTPDDPDAFERAVRSRASIGPAGPTESSPIV